VAELWDFDESSLLFSEDFSLCAHFWIEGQSAANGEYDTRFAWAIWDTESGEVRAGGSCTHTRGMWGESGRAIEAIEWIAEKERTLEIRYSDKAIERRKIAKRRKADEPSEEIVHLSLLGLRIGPEAAVALAGAPVLRRLTELDLRGNEIGYEGAKALVQPERLRRLQRLLLAETDTDRKGLVLLENRFGHRLELAKHAPALAADAPAYWTTGQWRSAIGMARVELETTGHEVAYETSGKSTEAISAAAGHAGARPPTFVVYRPGAQIVPLNPDDAFELKPGLAPHERDGACVVGITMRCRIPFATTARATLARVQELLAPTPGQRAEPKGARPRIKKRIAATGRPASPRGRTTTKGADSKAKRRLGGASKKRRPR